jgi:hypothetical protein
MVKIEKPTGVAKPVMQYYKTKGTFLQGYSNDGRNAVEGQDGIDPMIPDIYPASLYFLVMTTFCVG